MCLWNFLNHRHPPLAGSHETSRLDQPRHGRSSSSGRPSPPARCWMSPSGRQAGYSLGFGTGRRVVEATTPEESEKGSGLVSASGRGSTSIGSSSPRINGAEGATPLRASSPPPAEDTGTICVPEVTAAAPEFPPPPRHLADPRTHLPLHL